MVSWYYGIKIRYFKKREPKAERSEVLGRGGVGEKNEVSRKAKRRKRALLRRGSVPLIEKTSQNRSKIKGFGK